jgi:glucosyl-3-phosphoglycerate synthase
MDDPAVQELFRRIEQCGLSAGAEGKGRACWLAFGLLLGEGECDAIALHDCDIANYSREILAKLCFPVAHPALRFEFCKGFYARVTDRLHGRATRLFVAPLVQAMQQFAPAAPFLSYLASFRYPLAGEFAIAAPLLRRSRMPADWGLEIGMLAEMYRNASPRRICQVEVAENYEHKHQPLCPQDRDKGLRRMTIDVGKALLRAAAAEGVALSGDSLRDLELQYRRCAEEMIDRYEADALLNGLLFDRHEEESMVEVFAESLRDAAQGLRGEDAPLPGWNRVQAALPEVFDWLQQCGMHQPEPVRIFLPSWSAPAKSERALVRRAV